MTKIKQRLYETMQIRADANIETLIIDNLPKERLEIDKYV